MTTSPGKHSGWFLVGLLVAISLFATVVPLTLQRIFGAQTVLIALGPVLAVIGVLLFAFVVSRRGKDE